MSGKQVIVTWVTPDKKHPEEDVGVIATISGKAGNAKFDHAIIILFWSDDEGWYSTEYDFEYLIVFAWCDLEPYKGEAQER